MESSIAEFLSRQLAFGQLPTTSYFDPVESSASCSGWTNETGACLEPADSSSIGRFETLLAYPRRGNAATTFNIESIIQMAYMLDDLYLLGLLAMIKCSICSYQCDNWYVSNWRLACHIIFDRGGGRLGLPSAPQMLPWHGTLLWATHPQQGNDARESRTQHSWLESASAQGTLTYECNILRRGQRISRVGGRGEGAAVSALSAADALVSTTGLAHQPQASFQRIYKRML